MDCIRDLAVGIDQLGNQVDLLVEFISAKLGYTTPKLVELVLEFDRSTEDAVIFHFNCSTYPSCMQGTRPEDYRVKITTQKGSHCNYQTPWKGYFKNIATHLLWSLEPSDHVLHSGTYGYMELSTCPVFLALAQTHKNLKEHFNQALLDVQLAGNKASIAPDHNLNMDGEAKLQGQCQEDTDYALMDEHHKQHEEECTMVDPVPPYKSPFSGRLYC